jgi:hypothetical protein
MRMRDADLIGQGRVFVMEGVRWRTKSGVDFRNKLLKEIEQVKKSSSHCFAAAAKKTGLAESPQASEIAKQITPPSCMLWQHQSSPRVANGSKSAVSICILSWTPDYAMFQPRSYYLIDFRWKKYIDDITLEAPRVRVFWWGIFPATFSPILGKELEARRDANNQPLEYI